MKGFFMYFSLWGTTLLCACSPGGQQKYSIVLDSVVGEKVEYALGKLEEALAEKSIVLERVHDLSEADGERVVVAGLAAGRGALADLARTENRTVPAADEALSVWKTRSGGKPVLAVAGHDDQGLMYALLDVAGQIGWSSGRDPFKEVLEITEQPELAIRALSMYTMNRRVWEDKLYDEAYWEKYFDLLAESRFNSFVIIFGYENGGFLAPPYPYFFDVPGYPDVKMVGLSGEEQRRNLAALNRVIDLAHHRGLKLSVAVWDHIYRGGIQSGGMDGLENAGNEPLNGLVWGVTGENLIAYTKAALAELVERVPKLDGIEFRMHGESGLRHGEQEVFWTDVFRSMKTSAPEMKFVLRAKDMPESVIQAAFDAGLDFRIETKYWMEQMGLPFHPTHINRQNQMDRRQGYADMLHYPQQYKMYWRMWTGGTSRILSWGNPEYARRFVGSAKLYGGDAYEVNEPLATKMESMPHDAEPFDLLEPGYEYYTYEFERYWPFFRSFGRMGYNPDAPEEVWDREFITRFGPKAGPVLRQALEQAGWILPRIVASAYPYGAFPTTRGWAEKQRLGDLHEYARGEGSDIQQFASFDEEARMLIEGTESAKIRPPANSRWFEEASEGLNELISWAERAAGKDSSREFNAMVTDLKILSNLALYHARRIPAAVSYRLFVRTNNVSALDKAIEYEKQAAEAWNRIVEAAGDMYAPDLMFGVRSSYFDGLNHHLTGHWRDELGYLETGLEKLEQQRRDFRPEGAVTPAPEYRPARAADNGDLFEADLLRIERAPAGRPLTVQVKAVAENGLEWVRLRYRAVNQKLDYAALEMTPAAEKDTYEATIPAGEIDPRFDLMYFVEVMDRQGNGLIYPDLMRETPYVIVNLDR